jgi:uncharacterized membrane protein
MEALIVGFEAGIAANLRLAGAAIEVLGAGVIVAGILWSCVRVLRRGMADESYGAFRIRLGRSLLLGLEILVAADIVKTIAVEPTLARLGVLAGLVALRTFLGWTLALEIEGRWPWQAHRREPAVVRPVREAG